MNQDNITRWITCSLVILTLFNVTLVQAEPEGETVSKDKEVSIEYTLRIEGEKGLEVIDGNVGDAPMTFIQGSHNILPALENAIEGMKVGENRKVTLSPEQGYGLVNQDAIIEVKKDQIPQAALKVGTLLQAKKPNGETHDIRVAEIKKDTVVLDFNHLLAGKTLYYEVIIIDIKGIPFKTES